MVKRRSRALATARARNLGEQGRKLRAVVEQKPFKCLNWRWKSATML